MNTEQDLPHNNDSRNICVVGLGYIGLPTAALLARSGWNVNGVDINNHVIETINKGKIHIVEPELDIAVKSAVENKRLVASAAPSKSDAFFIAVPTPCKGADHTPDISYIQAAAQTIAPVLEAGNLVVLESTSPVGTTEKLSAWLAELRPDLSFPQDKGKDSDIRIAFCPERVLPGQVMSELVSNDRIIGGMTEKCAQQAREIYETFVRGACMVTGTRTAELCKLAENAYRDINIAYANELSLICDEADIDVRELIRLTNHHPRVDILQPGPGVGGHSIAVDPWFIVSQAPELSRLIRTAREVNDFKPNWVFNKVLTAYHDFEKKFARKPKLALMGLAFKPNIDDLRESPALQIAQKVYQELGSDIIIVEPHVKTAPENLKPLPLTQTGTAIHDADILVFLVAHTAFKQALSGYMRDKNQVILDFVGVSDELKKQAAHDTQSTRPEQKKA